MGTHRPNQSPNWHDGYKTACEDVARALELHGIKLCIGGPTCDGEAFIDAADAIRAGSFREWLPEEGK